MKTKLVIVLCVSSMLLSTSSRCLAETEDHGAAVVIDVLVARPAGLVATAVGSAFFVVALPFALMSKSVKPTAEALVVRPAKATFTRPLGDFDALKE